MMCGYDDASIAAIILRAKNTAKTIEPVQARASSRKAFRRMGSVRAGPAGDGDGGPQSPHKMTPLEVNSARHPVGGRGGGGWRTA